MTRTALGVGWVWLYLKVPRGILETEEPLETPKSTQHVPSTRAALDALCAWSRQPVVGNDPDTEAWTVEGITGRALWALSPCFCLKGPSIFRDQCEIWHVFHFLPFSAASSFSSPSFPFHSLCSSPFLFSGPLSRIRAPPKSFSGAS